MFFYAGRIIRLEYDCRLQKNIGCYSVLMVEFLGMFDGHQITQSFDSKKVIFEIDSKKIIQAIQETKKTPHDSYDDLIKMIFSIPLNKFIFIQLLDEVFQSLHDNLFYIV